LLDRLGLDLLAFRNLDLDFTCFGSGNRPLGNVSTIRRIKFIALLRDALLLKGSAN
jgi:hypothetical protein